jgi:hypothetical protein
MKQIEKDMLALGFIGLILKESGTNLEEQIPNYDKEKVLDLHLSTFKNEQIIREKMVEFAKECYNRIKKKFPQK